MANQSKAARRIKAQPATLPTASQLPLELFQQLFQSFPDAVFLIDSDARILELNEKAQLEFGGASASLVGQALEKVFPPAAARRLKTVCWQTRSGKLEHRDFLFRTHHRSKLNKAFRARLLCCKHSNATLTFVILQDVSAAVRTREQLASKQKTLQKLNLQLQELVQQDGLTGLYNRRFFEQAFEMEFARSLRYRLPLSLALIDVDNFKQVNDQYGHLMGDAVLQAIATVLKFRTRQSDVAARYGGEEFALILPHTDPNGAVQVAEKIRCEIAETIVEHKKHQISVTVSVGVTTLMGELVKREQLLERADQALYKAKRNGKNQTAFLALQPELH